MHAASQVVLRVQGVPDDACSRVCGARAVWSAASVEELAAVRTVVQASEVTGVRVDASTRCSCTKWNPGRGDIDETTRTKAGTKTDISVNNRRVVDPVRGDVEKALCAILT